MTVIETPVPPQTESPIELDETGQVLLRAADIIRTNGWAGPHEWGNPDAPRCIMGAVDEVVRDDTGQRPGYIKARKRLENSLVKDPVRWNNEPGRTQEQVIEALERAAIGA